MMISPTTHDSDVVALDLPAAPEQVVQDLVQVFKPAVSHHLALMRAAELIELRREGKHNFYRLVPQRFEQSLDLLFANIPHDERRIRFEKYLLSFDPARK